MKKVIFICLLSLSMCLSQPDGQSAPSGKPEPNLGQNNTTQAEQPSKVNNTIISTDNTSSTTQAAVAPLPKDIPAQSPAASPSGLPNVTTDKSDNKTAQDTKDAAVPAKEKGNNTNETSKAGQNITPGQGTVTNTPEPSKPTTEAITKKNETTSEKPDVSTKPTPKAEGDTTVQARGFDGASFVGGIILTLGLLAIGFMGFKYYKNQTERNYHTL